MVLFWSLLVLAILFVVGSAMALNALGRNKPSTRKKPAKKHKPH